MIQSRHEKERQGRASEDDVVLERRVSREGKICKNETERERTADP